MKPFETFLAWMEEEPENSKETRECFERFVAKDKKAQEALEDVVKVYNRYPETAYQKIAQVWVVPEERPAFMAYASGKQRALASAS